MAKTLPTLGREWPLELTHCQKSQFIISFELQTIIYGCLNNQNWKPFSNCYLQIWFVTESKIYTLLVQRKQQICQQPGSRRACVGWEEMYVPEIHNWCQPWLFNAWECVLKYRIILHQHSISEVSRKALLKLHVFFFFLPSIGKLKGFQETVWLLSQPSILLFRQ